MKKSTQDKLTKVGGWMAAIGAVIGYAGVQYLAPDRDCGVVTYATPVLQCGFWEGMIFRFQNFAAVVGAVLCALPGIGLLLWAATRDDPTRPSEGE